MRPEVRRLTTRAGIVAWVAALVVWTVALVQWPDVPSIVVEATRLAALYALARS